MKSEKKIMGILNCTPNSFSDGGNFTNVKKANVYAQSMIDAGADIIDIGGESTAPGNHPISAKEEWSRIEAIVLDLLQKKIPLSLDSYHGENWEKFLQAGGNMLNDVSGLQKDQSQKIELLQEYAHTTVCIMYSRNPDHAFVNNPIDEIYSFFETIISFLLSQRIQKHQIIIDPGMGGFLSYDPEVSFMILRHLHRFLDFGLPILVGTSRKSFLQDFSLSNTIESRDMASVMTSLYAWQQGATIVRVHNVAMMKKVQQLSEKLW